MTGLAELLIAAGSWVSFTVEPGEVFDIALPHGPQVVDLWGFCLDDPTEVLSMPHSRLHMGRLSPRVGDVLVTTESRAALELLADTSGGAHDTLLPACDRHRYERLGASARHANCADNLRAGVRALGLAEASVPSPLNLFENAPVADGGELAIQPPVAQAESYVRLSARLALAIVCSACPQDLVPTNGADRRPKPALVRRLGRM